MTWAHTLCGTPQADVVDIAYPPLFQSGGEYDLKMSSVSSDAYMHYGVIVCSLGARCAGARLRACSGL